MTSYTQDRLLDLLEQAFGPRPIDQDELHAWKVARWSYLYGNITTTIPQLEALLAARAVIAQPSTEKENETDR